MSDYQERNNAAKAVKRGIKEPRPPKANRKKPKVKGPWKVLCQSWFLREEYVVHHCATEELAKKMLRKKHLQHHYRIEYREET